MFGIVKVVAGVVAAAGIGTTVAVAVAPTAGETDRAVVSEVVDGDTIDVSIDGRTERVRLLNIDTPETKDPDEPVQCLGPEATAFLASLIPVGSTVTLEYDEVRTDRYDRTLAGVFTDDGALVNAEVARQGFAAAVVFDGNDRFHPPVVEARDQAAAAGRGLFAEDVPCTLPARVAALAGAAASAPTPESLGAAATEQQLDDAAAEVAGTTAAAFALERAFAGDRAGPVWGVVPRAEQDRLAAVVTASLRTARTREAHLRAAAQDVRDREARAAAARAAEEAAREAAEQQRREREAQARRRAETPPAAAPDPRPAAAPAAGGCEAGYSPCVPSYPPDLDCGDLGGPYSVSGSDPHRLDRDDDGSGCE